MPLWFEYLLLILLIILFALSITNAVYYGRAKEDPNPTPPISSSTGETMMWINVALAVVSFVSIILLIVRLIWFREDSGLYRLRTGQKDLDDTDEVRFKIRGGIDCNSIRTPSKQVACQSNEIKFSHMAEKATDMSVCQEIALVRGEKDELSHKCRQNVRNYIKMNQQQQAFGGYR